MSMWEWDREAPASLPPWPGFQVGEAVWVKAKVVLGVQGGRVDSTSLKLGWGLRWTCFLGFC